MLQPSEGLRSLQHDGPDAAGFFCRFSARKTQAEDEKQVTPTGQGPRNMRHKNDEVRVITNHKLVRPGSALPHGYCFSSTHPQGIFERFSVLKFCCKPYDH